jgi:hypothetical protein
LLHGSRFATRAERGLWYGAAFVRTTLAEVAYYRLLFLEGTAAKLDLASDLNVFRVQLRTRRGVDLTAAPFAAHTARISSPTTYTDSQELGKSMREAGVQAFRYQSARDERTSRWEFSLPGVRRARTRRDADLELPCDAGPRRSCAATCCVRTAQLRPQRIRSGGRTALASRVRHHRLARTLRPPLFQRTPARLLSPDHHLNSFIRSSSNAVSPSHPLGKDLAACWLDVSPPSGRCRSVNAARRSGRPAPVLALSMLPRGAAPLRRSTYPCGSWGSHSLGAALHLAIPRLHWMVPLLGILGWSVPIVALRSGRNPLALAYLIEIAFGAVCRPSHVEARR